MKDCRPLQHTYFLVFPAALPYRIPEEKVSERLFFVVVVCVFFVVVFSGDDFSRFFITP